MYTTVYVHPHAAETFTHLLKLGDDALRLDVLAQRHIRHVVDTKGPQVTYLQAPFCFSPLRRRSHAQNDDSLSILVVGCAKSVPVAGIEYTNQIGDSGDDLVSVGSLMFAVQILVLERD